MPKSEQLVISGVQEYEKPQPDMSPAGLLQLALQKESNIEIIERLAKLQLDMRRLDAEVDFNEALRACQEEVKTVVNDAKGQHKMYATYKQLDKEVRPIYLKHGLDVSFDSGDCSIADHIMILAHVSLGLHTRTYRLPMDISGRGPKGDGALSRPHAILAATEYGRRALLKMIFNIVSGDEDILTNSDVMANLEAIEKAEDLPELERVFKAAYKQAKELKQTDAMLAYVAAKDKRKAALQS